MIREGKKGQKKGDVMICGGLINQTPTEEPNPDRNNQAVGLMNQAPT